jgi:hypothetical protein
MQKTILLALFSALLTACTAISAAEPDKQEAKPAKPKEIVSGSISMIYEGLPVARTDKDAKIGNEAIPGADFLIEPNGRGQVNGHPLVLRDGQSFRVGDKVSFYVEEKENMLLLPQVGQTVTYSNYHLEVYRMSSRFLRVRVKHEAPSLQASVTPPTGSAPAAILDDPEALNGLSAVVVASGYEISGMLPPHAGSPYLVVTLFRK